MPVTADSERAAYVDPHRRHFWIGVGSLLGALALQAAILAAAVLRKGSSPFDNGISLLLSEEHRLADFVEVLRINCLWLLAIFMIAWPIGRHWSWSIHDTWDHPKVNLAARFVYPFLACCVLVALGWVFVEQAFSLDKRLETHWALLTTLSHGTLEFGGFLLPLAAAASCIVAPAERPGRLLLRTLGVALVLVFFAAMIEIYVTPHLLAPYRL